MPVLATESPNPPERRRCLFPSSDPSSNDEDSTAPIPSTGCAYSCGARAPVQATRTRGEVVLNSTDSDVGGCPTLCEEMCHDNQCSQSDGRRSWRQRSGAIRTERLTNAQPQGQQGQHQQDAQKDTGTAAAAAASWSRRSSRPGLGQQEQRLAHREHLESAAAGGVQQESTRSAGAGTVGHSRRLSAAKTPRACVSSSCAFSARGPDNYNRDPLTSPPPRPSGIHVEASSTRPISMVSRCSSRR